jgi:hypothetical protein
MTRILVRLIAKIVSQQQDVERMWHPGVDVELGRHPGPPELSGVADVLVAEDVHLADFDVRGREPGEVRVAGGAMLGATGRVPSCPRRTAAHAVRLKA